MNLRLILFFVVVISSLGKATAQDFEWNLDNTGTTPGERVVAILDAGTVGSYTGAEIIGQVIDNNGNWGYKLPTVADFRLYVRYSGGISYDLVQTQRTAYISLGLRKISDSKVHLVANCPSYHKGMRVIFKKVEGTANVTLGNPTTISTEGELLVSEPKYYAAFNEKVGVGVGSPDAQMCLGKWDEGKTGTNGSVQLRLSGLFNEGTNLGGTKLLIEGYDNDGSTTYPIYLKDENSKVDYWIRSRPSAKSLPTMFFAGNIGIGKTSPEAKLDVAGTIRASEIKVEAQTADFVFEDNYPLRNLSKVEEFIKENKHLPDIPSAEEMGASGVDLAEMNKLLLQKIEELTLYVIKKEKEVKTLESAMITQGDELKCLENKLLEIEGLIKKK